MHILVMVLLSYENTCKPIPEHIYIMEIFVFYFVLLVYVIYFMYALKKKNMIWAVFDKNLEYLILNVKD